MSLIKFTFIVILFIISTKNKSDGAKAIATEHLYLDHMIYKFNSKYAENCTCKLNFITRLQKSYSSSCFIKKEVDNVLGYLQLYYKFRSGYKIFLIDAQVNACDYINKKIGSKPSDFVYPTLLKHMNSTRPLRCPYYGEFIVDRLPINGALFSSVFLPVGDYMVNITATTETVDKKQLERGETIWSAQFYFTIPTGKTIEDDRMGR